MSAQLRPKCFKCALRGPRIWSPVRVSLSLAAGIPTWTVQIGFDMIRYCFLSGIVHGPMCVSSRRPHYFLPEANSYPPMCLPTLIPRVLGIVRFSAMLGDCLEADCITNQGWVLEPHRGAVSPLCRNCSTPCRTALESLLVDTTPMQWDGNFTINISSSWARFKVQPPGGPVSQTVTGTYGGELRTVTGT